MKFGYLVLFFTSFAVAFAVVPTIAAQSSAPPDGKKKSVDTKKSATKTGTKKAGASVKTGSKRKGKSSGKSTTAAAGNWRTHQQAPTAERYKEIQQALITKGYLKSEPNGVWDAQSVDALKQFQTDQKLIPSGKINAASLIGLGLGGAGTSPSPSPQAGESVPDPGQSTRPDLNQ